MAERSSIRDSLEADLNKAIEQSISSSPVKGAGESRRAVDQLAQARDGLLKVEQELNALLDQVAGSSPAPEGSRTKIAAAGESVEGLPMFDRVRADATALAELAIRMHGRISHALERL